VAEDAQGGSIDNLPAEDVAKRARQRIDARLAEIPRHLAALRETMAGIGEEFSLEEVEAVYDSDEPRVLNQALAIERGFEILQNYIVELAVNGLILAGLRSEQEIPNAPRDLQRLADANVIAGERCKRLIQTQRLRNLMQHEYASSTAEHTHEGVSLLVAELPGFLDDYGRWLESFEGATPEAQRPRV